MADQDLLLHPIEGVLRNCRRYYSSEDYQSTDRILFCLESDQLTYTAPEVENLKRSFPSGYAYETRACEVDAVINAHFTVALGVFFFRLSSPRVGRQ